MTVRRALGVALVVVVAAAVIVGLVALDRSDARAEQQREREAIDRVNTICGTLPADTEHHNAGWSNGPYWTVTCPNGTEAIVEAG